MKLNELTVSQKIGACIAGALLIIAVAFGVGAFAASAQTFETFPSHFYVGGVDVGGKNFITAQTSVQKAASALEYGVSVTVANYGTYKVPVGKNLIDIDATMKSAKQAAQRGALTRQLRELFGMSEQIETDFEVTNAAAEVVTDELIASWNVPLKKPTDAKFDIQHGVVTVVSAVNGQTIDQEELSDSFITALEQNRSAIIAAVVEGEPLITTDVADQLRPQAAAVAAEITKGRTISIKTKTFSVASSDLLALLQPRMVDDKPTIGIDPEMLKAQLHSKLSAFEQEAKNPEFERTGNKVTKFVAPQTGLAIDWDKLAQDLYTSLSANQTTVAVATKEAEPEISLASLNDLGLKEVIGVGLSNFKGSPKNRRHNIAVGVASLKNLLIQPGETFSLIKALGAIDGTTGYLEELVIKDNKTTPEFGGGLCQIGTTTFRAAMGAGFPIVERRNHSYQVGYYFENGLPGTDATIYDPKPDFRFKNDTAHWVMLEPRIKGDNLEFVFWGTSDGRVATRTLPKVLSRTPAPPKKLTETLDLPPGTVKCTEKAHAGASVVFTYSVVYPNGDVKKEDFSSYYKPWAEVCLVGVAALTPVSGDPAIGGPTAVPQTSNIPPTISSDASGATGN